MTEEMGGLLAPCANCGHLGFSHDNWTECAECECEQYVPPRDYEP
jgi:hypothetical protein